MVACSEDENGSDDEWDRDADELISDLNELGIDISDLDINADESYGIGEGSESDDVNGEADEI
ncbi:hypothetical protein H4R18_000746 [Coemansia javaensis]|uniref:Uncharacterized protein n=1 Tax=Coemansia javaensis TaxID=2761396 RepID=A0A9W8HHD3_9FUNG|nr:hypothetical protein H4R18_000746 [Coemansia javaensis]